MSNEIDTLMDLDPLSLTSDNIDQIIAYHRNHRAQKAEGGGKVRKEAGPKLSLSGLIEGMTAAKPKQETVVKRRI